MIWANATTVILIAGFTAGVSYWAGSTIKQGQWDAAKVAEKAGKDDALKAAAAAIAKIQVKSEKHVQPIITEVRTNTVYRECQHSDDSLRHLNALIESTGDGGLPETGAAP